MNIRHFFKTFLLLLAAASVACSKSDCGLDHTDKLQGLPAISEGSFPHADVDLAAGESFAYAPQMASEGDVYYQWWLNEEDVSTDPTYTYTATKPTRSRVILELTNDYGKVSLKSDIIVPGADYTTGGLIINEGWFGHETGSVTHLRTDGTVETWAMSGQNFGEKLGITSQSATMWNGKLYICSKDGQQLTVVDPRTLYIDKSFNVLKGYYINHFIGINENYGVVTTNQGDLYRIDLKTYEVLRMPTKDGWRGPGGGIVYNGKLLLNVCGTKLHAYDIDRIINGDDLRAAGVEETLDIFTQGFVDPVIGADGNLYVVETDKNGVNKLARISSDWSIEKCDFHPGYAPPGKSVYRESSFSASGDSFYFTAGGRIYKCRFGEPVPQTPLTDYAKEGYGFYGAGLRANPATGELVATYLTRDYSKNLVVRFNGATGAVIAETTFDGYFFPATIIFNR